jgi:hypothetical protein
VTRLEVHFSSEAADQLAGLLRQRRRRLERELGTLASSAAGRDSVQGQRFIQARTQLDIAACEVIEDAQVLLVYAIISRRDLLRRIWGPECDDRLTSRRIGRLIHGRGWDG